MEVRGQKKRKGGAEKSFPQMQLNLCITFREISYIPFWETTLDSVTLTLYRSQASTVKYRVKLTPTQFTVHNASCWHDFKITETPCKLDVTLVSL